MRRFTRKIISAMKNSKESNPQSSQDSPEDAFFKRMFVGVASSLLGQTLRERNETLRVGGALPLALQNEKRDIYMHIADISVAMLGVCLTGVSILNVDKDINDGDSSFGVDDILAFDSVVFLISYMLSFWFVRVMTKSNRNVRRIGNIANGIFFVGMILMSIVCVGIVQQSDYLPRKILMRHLNH
jgi:hypothetical protein